MVEQVRPTHVKEHPDVLARRGHLIRRHDARHPVRLGIDDDDRPFTLWFHDRDGGRQSLTIGRAGELNVFRPDPQRQLLSANSPERAPNARVRNERRAADLHRRAPVASR